MQPRSAGLMDDARFHLCALLVLWVSFFANQLWVGGMPGNDDGTYAAGALDMMDAGDWLTPRFNGEPQFSTAPPAFYWVLAASMKVFGPGDLGARLGGSFSTLAALLLVFAAGRRLLGGSVLAGALAACFFALDPFVLKSGHHAVAHTAWMAAACGGLLCLERARRRPAWLAGYAACLALSILLKSLLGTFLVLIGGVWLIWDRASRRELALFAAASLAGLAAGGSWHLLEYARHGDRFVYEHLGQMLFVYAFNFKAVNDALSPWEHARALVLRAAQNSTILLPALLALLWRGRDREAKLIFAWAAVPTAALALTARFEPRYMAPAFPGLALALAWTARRYLSPGRQRLLVGAVYAAALAWALATLAYPIPRGRDHLAEARPLIDAIMTEVSEGRRWLLVVSPLAPIDPGWPNRMLVDHYEMSGPVNRGLIQQLLFYTRRRFTAVHAPQARSAAPGTVVLAQDRYLPRGSEPRLAVLLHGPDWTLYRAR